MKTKLIFNRKSQLDRHGEAGITIKITLHTGQRLHKKTGVKCVPSAWDAKYGQVKIKDHDYINKNLIIQRELTKINDFYKGFFVRGKEPTAKDFEMLDAQKHSESFNEFFLKNITKSRSQSKISPATLTVRQRCLQLWNEYSPKTDFDNLGTKLVTGFREFLIDKRFAVNTIDKHLRVIKTMILMAKIEGIVTNNPMDGIIHKTEKSGKKYSLTFEQVEAIKNLDYQPDKGSLFHVWKLFLFACRTAFRFSDVFDFSNKHVSLTENGWFINKRSVKLKAGTYRIQLRAIERIFGDNLAEEILLLYYDEMKQPNEKIFPTYSQKTVSDCIKKIVRDAELTLDHPLTFHIARHTCATQLAAKDVGLHKIMRIGGWESPNTIKHYIDMADDLLGRM